MLISTTADWQLKMCQYALAGGQHRGVPVFVHAAGVSMSFISNPPEPG
jgi:hypothetical protein